MIVGRQGGAILQKLDCRPLQRHGSLSVFWSPFGPGLLWRETEVVGQVPTIIGGKKACQMPKQDSGALVPKGGEQRSRLLTSWDKVENPK
jgi:surface antigen